MSAADPTCTAPGWDSAAIARELNRRCPCSTTDVSSLHEHIERALREIGAAAPLAQTHAHLFSDAPMFVAQRDIARMQQIIAAVEDVVRLPAYRARVLSSADAAAAHDQGARGVLFGYDFHLGEQGPQLIEINTNAGGILLNTQLIRAQQACCADFLRLAVHQDAEAIEASIVEMFEREYERVRGKARLRRIAIVDDAPEQQYLHPEFMLFKRLFESRGIAASILDPTELRLVNGRLHGADGEIDLVYNRLTDFSLADRAHAVLREAYLTNAAVVTPHPRAHALYADKRNLTLLSDAAALRSFGAGESAIETLISGVPSTVEVRSGDASRWWSERARWFFKPTAGFGSRGAYRGDKLTRGRFADVMASDYVAQEIVPASERWREDHAKPLKVDVRCYVYDGRMLLMAARLYDGQTTNFRTPGGGFAAVYALL